MKKIVSPFLLFLLVLFFNCEPSTLNEIVDVKDIIINEPALTVSKKGGIYYNDLTVDILCGNSDVKIYYTLDGSEPKRDHGTLYASSIFIGNTTTLRYMAFLDDIAVTNIKKESYNFQIKQIEVRPLSGEFTSTEVAVSLISETKDATIIYTTDGTTPTRENGKIYNENIVVNYFTILKFFAYKSGYGDTQVFRYAYSFKVLPTILNLFDEDNDIEIYNDTPIFITCDTPGINIYYTLNGDLPSSNSFLYNGSIILTPNSLGDTVTIKTNAYKYGFAYSELKEEKYIFKVADVNMTPQPGNYDTSQTVTLSCALAGTNIYYTTDGSEPTSLSTLYTTPLTINSTTELKAIGIKSGFKDSKVIRGDYKFVVKTPYFSAPSGIYKGSKSVKIYDNTSGATIRYIITDDNNTNPDVSSTEYIPDTDLLITDGKFLKAISFKSGLETSTIATFKNSVDTECLKVANPVFSLSSGTYSGKQTVTITCIDSNAKLYYTTSGATPNYETSGFFDGSSSLKNVDIFNTQTLKCVAYIDGYEASDVVSATYTITDYKVDNPVLSLSSGTYNEPKTIEITHQDPNVEIRYTTDGSDPTTSSGLFYGVPIVITGLDPNVTLKVKCFKTGYTSSDIVSGSYTFKLPNVSFNPVGGEYNSAIELYLSQPVTGSTIWYTTDGSDPDVGVGTQFTGTTPVTVANGMTVKAISGRDKWLKSDVVSHSYTLKLNKPIFITDATKNYTGEIKVQIEIIPRSASIKYTVDGSDPKSSATSLLYTGPIPISSETKIRCYGYKSGWNDSDINEKTYKFGN